MKKLSGTIELLLLSLILQAICTLYPAFTEYLAFVPNQLSGWIGLISHMVAHANWPHLLGNFGFGLPFMLYLEHKLGKKAFLEFYFICGIASAMLNLLMMGGEHGMIGSSGAIMGCAVGAAVVYGDDLKHQVLGLGMVCLLLLPQLADVQYAALTQVAVWGHVGGALMALLLSTRLYKPLPVQLADENVI